MKDRLLHQLTSADPLHRAPADESAERMERLRRVVDARTEWAATPLAPTRRSRSVRRRWITVASGAVAVAVVGSAGLSLLNPDSGPSLAGRGIALDQQGDLTCPRLTDPAPIPVPESDVRYLPTYLPPGWHVGRIWATKTSGSSCYPPPSLTAVIHRPDGRVTDSVMIRGPLSYTVDLGSATVTATTVSGYPAKMIVLDSPKAPNERVWLWQDAHGRTWFMKSYGFTGPEATHVASAVRVDGDVVRIRLQDAPVGLQVVAQRAGKPYGAMEQQELHITLGRGVMNTRGDGEVWLRVIKVSGGPLGLDGAFPLESSVVNLNGHLAIKGYGHGGMNLYEPSPGLAITFDPPWNGGEATLGTMTASQWERVVLGLQLVSQADPRLTSLAPIG